MAQDLGGRPSKYDPESYPRIARQVTGEGKTLVDLAKLLEVNKDTITEWQKKYPEFSVAIKMGREDSCDRVERALFERAIGYSHATVKPMVVSQGRGEPSVIELVPLTEHYPPDTAAASLFLRNRRPKEWKEKQEIAHNSNGGIGVMIVPAPMNLTQWQQMVAEKTQQVEKLTVVEGKVVEEENNGATE